MIFQLLPVVGRVSQRLGASKRDRGRFQWVEAQSQISSKLFEPSTVPPVTCPSTEQVDNLGFSILLKDTKLSQNFDRFCVTLELNQSPVRWLNNSWSAASDSTLSPNYE